MRLLTEIALVALAAVGVAVCLALLPEVAHKRRRPVQRALLAPPGQLGELRGWSAPRARTICTFTPTCVRCSPR
jgi:hypothetical protein